MFRDRRLSGAAVVLCALAASACASTTTRPDAAASPTVHRSPAPTASGATPPTNGSTSSTSSRSSTSSTQSPGDGRPFAYTVRRERFVDTTRPTASPGDPAYSPARTLPTDIYLPATSAPRPLIMFSHGYHGAPRKFTELFGAWARAGYVVAAPRFPLTSDRGRPYDEVGDFVNQPGDISFVLTQLLDGPLQSHIDASHIGAAGLSLGGATTYGLIESPCCRDMRLRAAAVFDAVHAPIGVPFEPNTIPLLIAHIDSDVAVPYSTARQAYAETASPKWLLTLHTGLHPEAYEDTPSPHDRTATQTSIDYFDLTLLGDASARARLLHDGRHPGESTIVAG
jgi:dienelactone hydrolase